MHRFQTLREGKAKYNDSIDKVAAEVRTVTEGARNVLPYHHNRQRSVLGPDSLLNVYILSK